MGNETQESGGGMFKPLVWSREGGRLAWHASSLIGRFTVSGGQWWGPEPTNTLINCDDDEAGKLAAEGEYQRLMAGAMLAGPPSALSPAMRGADRERGSDWNGDVDPRSGAED